MIGNIIRDLFTEDRGGFFEDSALLEQLAAEKLERIAAEVREAEDGKPAIDGGRINGDGDQLSASETEPEEYAGDDGKPLSDSLIRDLTAHRMGHQQAPRPRDGGHRPPARARG